MHMYIISYYLVFHSKSKHVLFIIQTLLVHSKSKYYMTNVTQDQLNTFKRKSKLQPMLW